MPTPDVVQHPRGNFRFIMSLKLSAIVSIYTAHLAAATAGLNPPPPLMPEAEAETQRLVAFLPPKPT